MTPWLSRRWRTGMSALTIVMPNSEGRWTLAPLAHKLPDPNIRNNPELTMTLLDMPRRVAVARARFNTVRTAISERVCLLVRGERGDWRSAVPVSSFLGGRLLNRLREVISHKSSLIAKSTRHAQDLLLVVDKLQLALESIDNGLALFSSDGQPLVVNRRMIELAERGGGIALENMNFQSLLWAIGLVGTQPNEETTEYRMPSDGTSVHHEYAFSDGSVYVTDLKQLSNAGILVTVKDISKEKRAQAEIDYLAHNDPLTGLANRAFYQLELGRTIERMKGVSKTAVLCLDLDRFKTVNDALGHAVGDELLKHVAQRIRHHVRTTDVVARLGGDEFAVIQLDVRQPENVAVLARRLVDVLAEPFDIGGNAIQLGATVGIALAPDDSIDGQELMKMAEIALHKAKADGRNTLQFFEAGMGLLVSKRRELERDLRLATAANAFELHYQPLLDLASDTIVGFEALIRWRHPTRGLVSPMEFIPLAEEIGLIKQIGGWVMKQACQDAATWPENMRVAINLSADQFDRQRLPIDVTSALTESGLSATRLELEITESVLLKDTAVVIDLLHQLKAIGVRIAMDDFGTGYSSLAYLHKFPFDKIKIDRAFVADIDTKPTSRAIVRAVASMSKSLGIETTGEGVETALELQCLRNEGCTQAQGFLISKPVTGNAVLALIASCNRRSLAA
jgi:diguanylate cyclase (GGDEF)-like protein